MVHLVDQRELKTPKPALPHDIRVDHNASPRESPRQRLAGFFVRHCELLCLKSRQPQGIHVFRQLIAGVYMEPHLFFRDLTQRDRSGGNKGIRIEVFQKPLRLPFQLFIPLRFVIAKRRMQALADGNTGEMKRVVFTLFCVLVMAVDPCEADLIFLRPRRIKQDLPNHVQRGAVCILYIPISDRKPAIKCTAKIQGIPTDG